MEWSQVEDQMEEVFTRFDPLFARSEPREHFRLYVRGLMSDAKRKNNWQMAEEVGLEGPQHLQRLLNHASWDAEEMGREIRQLVKEELGYEPGVGVLDESGFPKEGSKSVGVKRQYCGALGKVDNCQVGVFLGYVTPQLHALIDRELYLPQEWCADQERRAEARVPESVAFQTKPELAQQMLARAWEEGLPLQWVLGDTTYGNSPGLRNFIDVHERWYIMAVPCSAHVIPAGTEQAQAAQDLVATLPSDAWQRWALPGGEKGEIVYDWVALRVTSTTDAVGEQWLLIRRDIHDTTGLTFFLSNAPADTALPLLVRVASARHHVERGNHQFNNLANLDYSVCPR